VTSRLSDEEILGAALRVLESRRVVHTLNRLWSLVLSELDKGKTGSSLTRERLRRLAALHPSIHLTIHTRETDTTELPILCPVCTTKLSTVKNRTLYGWEVTLERTCPVCGFWTGRKRRVPTYYVFTKEK
jgi:hypothetical protein